MEPFLVNAELAWAYNEGVQHPKSGDSCKRRPFESRLGHYNERLFRVLPVEQ